MGAPAVGERSISGIHCSGSEDNPSRDLAAWSTMPVMDTPSRRRLARLALMFLLGVAFSASAAGPHVIVHKDPYCGCCNAWIEHLREAGFQVEARNESDMGVVKARAGVPRGKRSCHTAMVGGYFIEGHVPAGDVKRLLQEKPEARGLVLPGMPMGSPGMEMPDGRTQPYTVELVANDGSTRPYAQH